MTQLAYFKDRFLPEAECFVPISDRSYRFGDGVFETVLVVNGKLYDFARHLRRLSDGLTMFRIPLDVSGSEAICNELIKKNGVTEGYVRLVVSRGENGVGSVGYLPRVAVPYLLIQALAKPYPSMRSLRLWHSSTPAAMVTPSKTNNALIYTLAMMEADDNGCDNALLLDGGGHVCETGSGNIFWIKDKVLYTPSLDLPLVPGTMRGKLLELWQGEVREGHFRLGELLAADEVFMTNIASVVAAVAMLAPEGQSWPVGAQTQGLRDAMDRDIAGATR